MAGSVGSEDGDLGFQVAPMVDIVFVLMLFFMACAGAVVKQREIAIRLPSSGHSPVPIAPVVISIDSSGVVQANDLPLGKADDHQLNGLREWLRNAHEKFGNGDPVFIRPAMSVRHERVIAVLSAVGASGVKNLTFY